MSTYNQVFYMSEEKLKVINLILEYRDKTRKLSNGILKKWGSHIEPEELDSVSDLSLCEAAQKFDETKGVSFITFLFYYLKGNLVKAVTRSSTINGSSQKEFIENIGDDTNLMGYENIKDSINDDISDALIGTSSKTPIDILLKKELYNLGKEACIKLDDTEKKVIEKIYLKGEQVLDVAKELGYSRCHVFRIKKNALDNMEKSMTKKLEFERESNSFKEFVCKKTTRRKNNDDLQNAS